METHDTSEFYIHKVTGVPVHKATAILTFESLIGALEDNAEGIDAAVLKAVIDGESPAKVFGLVLRQGREAMLQVMAEDAS